MLKPEKYWSATQAGEPWRGFYAPETKILLTCVLEGPGPSMPFAAVEELSAFAPD